MRPGLVRHGTHLFVSSGATKWGHEITAHLPWLNSHVCPPRISLPLNFLFTLLPAPLPTIDHYTIDHYNIDIENHQPGHLRNLCITIPFGQIFHGSTIAEFPFPDLIQLHRPPTGS